MSEPGCQTFSTHVLLSVVTGKLLVPAWELYEFLDFMAGAQVWPGDVAELIGVVADEVTCQYPQFRRLVLEDAFWVSDVTAWMDDVASRIGWEFSMCPVAGGVGFDHRLETVCADERYL